MDDDLLTVPPGLILTQLRHVYRALEELQFGQLLMQLRYARRALEDVERSTARYTGGGFAAALQAGPHFGEPPLLDGALKVYVVNINDLTAGQQSLVGNLLGGIGGLIGGIGGGFVGGFV